MKEKVLMENSESENLDSVGPYWRTASLGDASSLVDQERVCLDFLDQAYGPGGYQVKVYTDDGFGGNRGSTVPERCQDNARPGLSALAAAVATGEIQVVIVHRLDRIARRFALCLEFLVNVIENHGCSLIFAAEQRVIRSAHEYLKGVTGIEVFGTRK